MSIPPASSARGARPLGLRRLRLRLAGVASLLLVAPLQAATLRCDSTTTLTVVGVDTAAERVLFGLPVEDGTAGWLVQADLRSAAASAWEEKAPAGGRFGASNGPGAPLVASRCGDGCLQVLRFADGVWRPLGEPLLAAATMSVQATWDRNGDAWVFLLSSADNGQTVALGYRLVGGDWKSEGKMAVSGVGSPAAYPAPGGQAGIVTGDALFTPGAKPRRWLSALPAVAGAAQGELLWMGGDDGAHLGGDGFLRITENSGLNWTTVRWLPWATGEGDLARRPGREFWIELPDGDRSAPLAAVWNDQRDAAKARLFLAEHRGGAVWNVLLTTPQGILTASGERLPYNHMFRLARDRWVLVTGCIAGPKGPTLAMRRLSAGKLGDPELVPIQTPAAR